MSGAAAERITATILGCGSSGGVPRVGNVWGACDPTNPRNRRRRCSLLIEGRRAGSDGVTRVLFDTGCDLREQLLSAGIAALDAVLYTHAHADHIHGIDDLRMLALIARKRVPVYYSAETGERLQAAFAYCFETPAGSSYPPILEGRLISSGRELTIEGEGGAITIMPFDQVHGEIMSLGFRVGGLAYSCDLSDIPDHAIRHVEGLECWIVDALRPTPHVSHFSVADALAWIDRVRPVRAVLTNMTAELDYETLDRETPANVTPAFDGMVIELDL
ncbi:MAG: MBL fold metallo-hydrolase [Alphaproteobacteria bacterium]|nr:MBL fold metallo-hydrolase [Alphaproteobacteria bacterium]